METSDCFCLSDIKLYSNEFDPINCTPGKNKNLTATVFEEGDVMSLAAEGDFGKASFLELKNENHNLCQSQFLIDQTVSLHMEMESSLLAFFYVLKNEFTGRLSDLEPQTLPCHHYNLIYLPKASWDYCFEKDKEYIFLNINFDADYLAMFSRIVPSLSEFLKEADGKRPRMLSELPTKASPNIMVIVQNILQCPYSGTLKELYLDTKVYELLLLALPKVSTTHPHPKTSIRQTDVEKIYAVRDHLVLNLDNPGTLRDIARMVGINDFKLKQNFKQVFGTTVFGMIYEERMQKALFHLKESDMTINEIASMTGYKNHSNFTAAFKKRFLFTPTDIRGK